MSEPKMSGRNKMIAATARQRPFRNNLAKALGEWRDAGGSIDEVIWAIDALVEQIVTDREDID